METISFFSTPPILPISETKLGLINDKNKDSNLVSTKECTVFIKNVLKNWYYDDNNKTGESMIQLSCGKVLHMTENYNDLMETMEKIDRPIINLEDLYTIGNDYFKLSDFTCIWKDSNDDKDVTWFRLKTGKEISVLGNYSLIMKEIGHY